MSTKLKDPKLSTIFWWLAVIIGVLVLFRLVNQMWEMSTLSTRLKNSSDEVLLLEEQQRAMEKQFIYETSQEYQEKQVREQLSMTKEGEVVLLFSVDVDELVEKIHASDASLIDENRPYWRQWADLLL